MITLTKFKGALTYLYTGIYALGAVFAFFGSIFQADGALFFASLLFAGLTYLFFLYAKAHFRIATRAENYIMLCKAVGINDDKEHSEEFFSRFTFERTK